MALSDAEKLDLARKLTDAALDGLRGVCVSLEVAAANLRELGRTEEADAIARFVGLIRGEHGTLHAVAGYAPDGRRLPTPPASTTGVFTAQQLTPPDLAGPDGRLGPNYEFDDAQELPEW